jgi:hypothetical protein
MKQWGLTVLILFTVGGCATRAVIADLEDDKVIVQASGSDMTVINAEAQKGCQVHDRTAVPISHTCLNAYCTVSNYLYACK